MFQYCYDPPSLGSDSIRLLRLMPNEDETAPIKCQLFTYPLQRLDKGNHLYEALSYVWGDPHNTMPIFVEEHPFPVTINLYAALSRLRDPFIDRILWVDSICINQANNDDKMGQIQSMARIYGQAHRVIVWLGVAADNSDRAVKAIRVAASKQSEKPSTDLPTHETLQQAIRALLRRPWFRRIWVLQEIAAARHVRVMCGSLDMGGYAFCAGLESLKHFYETLPELQSLIRSVVYLMKGATFRPDYQAGLSDRVSLDICPLGELIEMFHTREATLTHDKVYALIGMSSDNTGIAGFLPDYTVQWSQLFQRLVKFLLCQEVSVETWEKREIAVIKSRGCVIGQVSSIEGDQDDRQSLNIVPRGASEHLGYNKEWKIHGNLQASAKFVQEGDLVCLLQGTLQPTIIRPYQDYFAIIVIATTAPEAVRTERRSVGQLKLFQSRIDPPHDFLLVWDWETSPGRLQSRGECETLTEVVGQKHFTTALDKDVGNATRLWKAALILQDSGEYAEAKRRLGEAIKSYERALGKEDLKTLLVMETLALLYERTKEWKEAEGLRLQVLQTRQQIAVADHSDILSSMASLALCHRAQGQLTEAKKVEMMIRLLKLSGTDITERAVVEIATQFDEEVMQLLLDRKGDKIQVTENVVEAAAGNGKSGRQVMQLLLGQKGSENQITEGAVAEIVRWFDKEVIQLLLDRRGDEIQITKKVVEAAAGNRESGQHVMQLLLDRKGSKIQITEKVVEAAAGNERCGQQVVQLLLDRKGSGIQITEKVVEAAAGNGKSGRQVMQLLLGQKGSENQITEGSVAKIVRWFDKEVIQLLLDRRGDEIQITGMVVMAAKWNKTGRDDIMRLLLDRIGSEIQITQGAVIEIALRFGRKEMQLLLDRKGHEIQITDQMIRVVAGNQGNRQEIMQCLLGRKGSEIQITDRAIAEIAREFDQEVMQRLLDQRGSEIQITEKVVEAAAENGRSGRQVMQLLLGQKGSEIQITEGAVAEIARRFEKKMMQILLDRKGDEIQITEKVVEAAARNPGKGQKIMQCLLNRKGSEIKITEDAVAEIAERFNHEVMQILLDRKGDDIHITGKVVEAAARNFKSRQQVVQLLLDQKGGEIQITEGAVAEIARVFDQEVMQRLLDQKGGDLQVTENVVKAAAGNMRDGQQVMQCLIDRKGSQIQITEGAVAEIARRFDQEVMHLLLVRKGSEIQITEEVVAQIARRFNKEVMQLLLDRKGGEIQITEKVVEAAAGNEWSGQHVVQLLLDRKGSENQITGVVTRIVGWFGRGEKQLPPDLKEEEIQITEKVVEAAAGNWGTGQEVMQLLLDRRGDEIQITENVVKAAAGNWGSGQEVMQLLLNRRGDEIQITENVVKAAAGNERCGQQVVQLLLDRKGSGIQITEKVVEAAAGNGKSGQQVMQLLLGQKGSENQITEGAVTVIARRFDQEVVQLLLDRKGSEIQITEEAIAEIAGRFTQEVMQLLLGRKGSDIQITEKVVEAAAGNEKSGQEVIHLLLNRKGSEIQISEGAVAEIAKRFNEKVMQILLDRKGDEIQITEKVVEAVAGNWRSGQEVVQLLLDRKGSGIQVTGKVVEAAAENQKCGHKVLQLLLDRKWNETQITEGVVETMAGNNRSGKTSDGVYD